eukprot:6192990-Pleurochrysis_carterae.AAC.2
MLKRETLDSGHHAFADPRCAVRTHARAARYPQSTTATRARYVHVACVRTSQSAQAVVFQHLGPISIQKKKLSTAPMATAHARTNQSRLRLTVTVDSYPFGCVQIRLSGYSGILVLWY